MPQLGQRYVEALTYAAHLHREQVRKGTDVPYLSHLLSVSALVLEDGGDEDLAVAALLHDALEDQGDKTSYEDLRQRFGERVAAVVRECSDTEVTPKPPWRERKQDYLERLEVGSADAALVSAADKLHNARSILRDLRASGPRVWERFNSGPEDQLWYYDRLVEVLRRRVPGSASAAELRRTVAALHTEHRA